jgi:5-(carboxyamino)imidazole ribonucleotide synthase
MSRAPTLGILGGGQLGRMIAVAARQVGYGVAVYAPPGDNPAAGLADSVVLAPYEDLAALRTFAAGCHAVTYEFENIPAESVAVAASETVVRPSAALLGHTQDRIAEHALLDRLGIGHADGRAVHDTGDFDTALAGLGTPSRLKTARGGYDGGGQWPIRSDADAARARAAVDGTRAFRLERDVPFQREVSVVVARDAEGRVVPFPIFENEHRGGILHRTTWPAAVSPAVEARAVAIAVKLAEAVELVGTLTVECFVVGEDVLVNELAPRVHNSGHLTIEACSVSQFEQHVRAVCGLPLATPLPRGPACMVNVLGDTTREHVDVDLTAALGLPEVHVHLYGKLSVRARRKMGHVTALGVTREEAIERAEAGAAGLRFG